MTWATIRALRQPSALSVAGLANLEAQLHLGVRLHALDPGAVRLGRHPGCSVPQVAGHAHRPGGDLHPVETAFLAAWRPRACPEQADELATAALREAIASGDRDQVHGLADGGQVPLLLAISDNGPQMLSVTTREFMAGVAIARQFGRPGTPTGQAWIERRCSGTSRASGRTWRRSATPASFDAELDRVQAEYNSVRQHAAMGYVTRTTRTKAEARRSVRPAATGSPRRGSTASHTVGTQPCGEPVTASRSRLGITTASWLIKSDTPHIGRRSSQGQPTGRGSDQTSGGADAGDADR